MEIGSKNDPKYMILYVAKVTKVTKMVIKWGNVVHVGAKWYKVVHVGTNLLKEKYWQICGKLMALTFFFS